MIEAFRLGSVARGGTLFDGLDLAIGDGQAFLVEGASGSGKSTLLRLLAGRRRPDAGDILENGESLHRGKSDAPLLEYRSRVAVVDASRPPDPSMRVAELFRLSRFLADPIPATEASVRRDELLNALGLSDLSDAVAGSCSSSEAVRLSLAIELFREPRHLFCDGLAEAMGREWGERLLPMVRALAREGMSVVLFERNAPPRWEFALSDRRSVGPFLVTRLSPPISATHMPVEEGEVP